MATNDKPIRLIPDSLRFSADHYYRHFFLDLKCFGPVNVRPGSEAHKIIERLAQEAEDAAALDAAGNPPAAPMSVAEMIAWNAKNAAPLEAKR